ncbi:hypothetical protein TPHV1_90022 [Treponema phagedenis]|uniref:Uncharacterized protein n=1 Tax=Treponema phagedenis TaxID=162 RepID=A0A0B7GY00_TREPH|nr:hypothetical protein TPHV1_90022 [Treponema phagedenis]
MLYIKIIDDSLIKTITVFNKLNTIQLSPDNKTIVLSDFLDHRIRVFKVRR